MRFLTLSAWTWFVSYQRLGDARFLAVGAARVRAVAANAGCLGFLHPVDMPYAKQLTEPCQSVPRCCRDHVYIFMVNGLDPWNYGNLTGVRDYIQELGFNKTYYGQVYHVWWFNAEIRRIH